MADNQGHGYDIIGDIHGCADMLVRLLIELGYQRIDGVWRHRTRQAVFVGDFIDRGPYQLDAVAIPRAMIEAGAAKAVMGNHELNAIAYATRDGNGGWARAHSDKNRQQGVAFLAAARFGSPVHRELLDWFMTLPLWLDLDGVRVVHACWDSRSMDLVAPMLTADRQATTELIIEANRKDTPIFDAVKILLKGPEADLAGYRYHDKDGNSRDQGRLLWWYPDATTLQNGIRLPSSAVLQDPDGMQVTELPAEPLPEDLLAITPDDEDRSPVLFGHYWFAAGPNNETLSVIDGKAACVDFSAVASGPLVAYRWSGEEQLTDDNLVAVF